MLTRLIGDVSGVSQANSRLAQAIEKGNLNAVVKALAKGADPDCRDSDGSGVLMMAVFNKDLDTIRALIEAGADVNLISQYGNTAMDIAADVGDPDIVIYLLERGAKRAEALVRGPATRAPKSAPAEEAEIHLLRVPSEAPLQTDGPDETDPGNVAPLHLAASPDLRPGVDAVLNQITALENARAALTEERDALAAQLGEAARERDRLSDELARETDAREHERAKHNVAETTWAAARAELEAGAVDALAECARAETPAATDTGQLESLIDERNQELAKEIATRARLEACLNKDLDVLKGQIETLARDHDDDLVRESTKHDRAEAKLKKDLEAFESQAEADRTALNGEQAAHKKAAGEAMALRRQIEMLAREHADGLATETAQRDRAEAKFNTDLNALNSQVSADKAALDEEKAMRERAEGEAVQLRDRIETLARDHGDGVAREATTRDRAEAKLNKDLEALRFQTSADKAALKQERAALEQTRKEATELRDQIEALARDHNEGMADTIAKRDRAVAELNESLDALEARADADKATQNEQVTAREKAETEAATLRDRIEALTADNGSDLNALKAQAEADKAALNTHIAERDKAESEAATLRDRIEALAAGHNNDLAAKMAERDRAEATLNEHLDAFKARAGADKAALAAQMTAREKAESEAADWHRQLESTPADPAPADHSVELATAVAGRERIEAELELERAEWKALKQGHATELEQETAARQQIEEKLNNDLALLEDQAESDRRRLETEIAERQHAEDKLKRLEKQLASGKRRKQKAKGRNSGVGLPMLAIVVAVTFGIGWLATSGLFQDQLTVSEVVEVGPSTPAISDAERKLVRQGQQLLGQLGNTNRRKS
jgi:chromosome segregation ATPase